MKDDRVEITDMDVPVAIKEYNNKDISGYDEAVKEAKIAAGFYELNCISSARDFFTENELAYIVMEYVNGISIKRYIKENGPMPGQLVLQKVRPLMGEIVGIMERIQRTINAFNKESGCGVEGKKELLSNIVQIRIHM